MIPQDLNKEQKKSMHYISLYSQLGNGKHK